MKKAIEQLSEEYIKYCYGEMNETTPQYGEVKQAFIMGVWQMLHIAKSEDCTRETLDLIEDEIRIYQKLRKKTLEDNLKGK